MTAAQKLYLVLADAILVIHFAFVAFVVIGLLLVWIGKLCGWRFVRNIWFRVAHLCSIGVVAAESLAGFICPLTTWENRLRYMAGGEEQYQGSFIQHWLHQVMFFELNEKVFTVIFIIFFAAVALSFWLVPPRRRTQRIAASKPTEVPT
jgi:hypothetical protein